MAETVEQKPKEEVYYRTQTTTKNSTTTNKRTILSRSTNVNAVQVNCYDRDGNLKSKDMDQYSWEDRDAHNYEWSGQVKPPEVDTAIREEEAKQSRFYDGQCQRAIETSDDGKSITMLTSSDMCSQLPSIKWSGTVNEGEYEHDFEHTTATKLDGSKWVHNEESISISMGKAGLPKSSLNVKVEDFNGAVTRDKTLSSENGGIALVPPGQLSVDSKQQPVAPAPPLSPMERRQMRRSVNREMMAGINGTTK